MGIVRRGYDRVTLREVALKQLRPEADEITRARLLAEARVTAQLDHPNVVPVYDVLQSGSPPFVELIMKLVHGRTLGDHIHNGPELRPDLELERLLQVWLRVCDAITFAHARGVIHCDLKPSNIMVAEHGQVYLMDWGLALVQQHGERPVQTHDPADDPPPTPPIPDRWAGSPAYMAPEQARGDFSQIDERTDVFGLGAVLYEILTRHPPHQGASMLELLEKARCGEIATPEVIAPHAEVPGRLSAICMKALSQDRNERTPSVEVFRTEVEDFIRAGGWFATRRFASGELVLREGESGDRAYILSSGNCEVFRTIHGRHESIRIVGPDDVVGEVGLLTGGVRIASVRAIGEVSAFVVTSQALERELARRSWLRSLVRAAAERLAELEEARSDRNGAHPGK